MSCRVSGFLFPAVLGAVLHLSAQETDGDQFETFSNVVERAYASPKGRVKFSCRGVIVAWNRTSSSLVLEDSSGLLAVLDSCTNKIGYTQGDILVVSGATKKYDASSRIIAIATSAKCVGHTTPREPTFRTLAEISRACDLQFVRTKGHVASVNFDEIDPRWIFLVLQDKTEAVYVAVPATDDFRRNATQLIESKVEITGIAKTFNMSGMRRFFGKCIILPSPSDIKVLAAPPSDPFAAKPLESLDDFPPAAIRALGRRKLSGTALASWGNARFLLRSGDGEVHRIELAEASELPKSGTAVEAAGFPETDFFNINLTRAVYRCASDAVQAPDAPVRVSPETILLDKCGNRRIDVRYHGKAVTLRGIVRTVHSARHVEKRIDVDCGQFTIPVDVSANPALVDNLHIGSTIDASGICLMDSPNWQSTLSFPSINGFSVVARTPEDIIVLSSPSWWTPPRLMIVVAALFALLAGILVWNRLLNRLIVRRSHQLMREELARKTAEWRTAERTQLATELHDSLSQNLTGIACQIAAMKKSLSSGDGDAVAQLGIAERMLTSSRTELKRCLLDLRGNALNCRSMTDAIIATAKPSAGQATLSVRFDVPRPRLKETTVHAILCIIRELVANAVRHGHATEIQIAGAVESGKILFSVRDNGCGFDVACHPGVKEGHFGLSGVNERADRCGGRFTIESSPASGTYARVSMPIYHDANMNQE